MNARSPSATKGSNLRTRIREATAGAILDAAQDVFSDKGLHAASMNEIAGKAGVAVGTLYNHFADKETIIKELFAARKQEMLDMIDSSLAAHEPTFEAQLLRLVRATFDYYSKHIRFFRLLWADEPQPPMPTLASKPNMMALIHERYEKLMKRGLKERALRPEGGAHYAVMLMALMRGVGICSVLSDGKKIPPPEFIVQQFLRGAAV